MPRPLLRRLEIVLLFAVLAALAGCANARTVVLSRHAQAFGNLGSEQRAGLTGDQLDSLTPEGQTHADRAGVELRSEGVDLVLASPLGRAMQTGARIALKSGVDLREAPQLLPRTREESDQEVIDRVLALLRANEGESVVLVTHSDVVGVFLGWLRSQPGAADLYPAELGTGQRVVMREDGSEFEFVEGPR